MLAVDNQRPAPHRRTVIASVSSAVVSEGETKAERGNLRIPVDAMPSPYIFAANGPLLNPAGQEHSLAASEDNRAAPYLRPSVEDPEPSRRA